MSISQIENIFLELESLIKLQIQDKTLNNSEIEQKFKEGKELIDKLEDDDDEQYGLFRYKYHVSNANYLTIIGEVNKAKKQENLAKIFKEFSKDPDKIDTYNSESRLFLEVTLNDLDQTTNSEEEDNDVNTKDIMEKELEIIENILEDDVIKSIRKTFEQLNNIPKSFDDYKDIVTCEIILHRIADSPINESLIDLESSQTANISNDQKSKFKENKKLLISSLSILKSLVSKIAYSNRLAFINHTLNSPNKNKILFSNTLFTEEEINKRFRDIALHFHSDKTSRPNTPSWLQEKHRGLGVELFNSALEFKESLLTDLEEISQNEGYLTFYEKKANNLWKIAVDYNNALKGRWERLKLLNENDIKGIPSEKLNLFIVDNGILAYQQYRAACKIADKINNLKKQIEFRENMALCLYIANKFVEAQLYALSAIQLQLKNSQKVTQQDFIKTKSIFDKVKGGDPIMDTKNGNTTANTTESTKLDTEINLPNNTMALIKTVDEELSTFDKKTIQESISNDMTKISVRLMLKADRSLVRYQAPKEVILHAKNRALKHKVAGGMAMGSGIAIGGSVAVAGFADICQAVAIIGAGASVGGPLALIGGIFTLGLGIWAGVNLWKKGTLLLEEPEIREKLNNIMGETLKAYDQGDYQKFLDELSIEFKTGVSLVKLKKREDFINVDNIIDTLLGYGFRSDGIAYLLNLLGEVLSSGKIRIEGKTTKNLKSLATNAFDGVLSEKLETEAKTLDNRIFELRKKHEIKNIKYIISSTFNKFKDYVSLDEYSNIAGDHKNDSQEMPFQSRLEEIRNITKINRAIFDILDAGKEEIERAIETIKEVQNSIDSNYQFVNAAKWRHEVLEDLLWIIGGEELPKESSKESPKLSPITYIDDKYINYLNQQLKQAILNQEKVRLYNKIAVCYEQIAEKEEKINRLDGLRHWKVAQKSYEKAREIDPKNSDATLGFAKCLLKLSKYTQVIQLSSASPNLTSLSEYWCFRSIAYCRKADYKNAEGSVIEALKLDNKNKLADEQRLFLKKISKENTIKWRLDYYEKEKKAIKYETYYLKNSHNKETSPTYNILSIDGGGVCGIMPALWLSEIESRTHRPISHLFNLVSGTSTGGIVAAGLAIPSWEIMYNENNVAYYLCSNLKPKFSALDIINLYQNQVKDLFSKNNSWTLFKPRYTNKDRSSLFFDNFGNVRLCKALTELVIPAVDENNLTHTHLFTRYDDRYGYSNNDTFYDTLMATTAAPTFFPPHEIKGRGFFLDGALHHNNPSMMAYEKAIQYKVAKEKISVLSLGTGLYVPDPLNPDPYRGNLFWAQNLHKVVLPQQEGNTDNTMYSLLGNGYQRWQVWFEEPISLDDYESVPYLLELGNQYIEELDASDENPINKLVESFEKKGKI